MPNPTIERIRATLRLLTETGDITPQGVRVLENVCADEERKHA